jgi:hypothetical protein
MDSIAILWWQYPMLGIGAFLFANGVVALQGISATIYSKILHFSQLFVALTFLISPLFRII